MKKTQKIILAGAAVVAVAVGGVFYVKSTAKDPKDVVIDAFKSVYAEGQTNPQEELFGVKELLENTSKNGEYGLTLKLDSCSDENINAYAGSGLRIAGKTDIENLHSSINLAAIYNGMDLANVNGYYGDKKVMVSMPEISSYVFTADLNKDLGQQLTDSPFFGPMLEERGIDVAALDDYIKELIAQAEQNSSEDKGAGAFDVKALWDRYKEGCEAQDNFKAAMTVEKAEKGTYTVDGKNETCKGYTVNISKNSMVDFLRTSADFFLQDEELKSAFLKQLETTVKLSQLLGNDIESDIPSVKELQEQTYEETKENVETMIQYVDKALTDVQMTVYVDKSGRLAAMDAVTFVNTESFAGDEGVKQVKIDFHAEVKGGAYRLQNFVTTIGLTANEDNVTIRADRVGTYDGKNLEDSLTFSVFEEGIIDLNGEISSTYESETGKENNRITISDGEDNLFTMNVDSTVDELEKGKSLHGTIDSAEFTSLNGQYSAVFSGEGYLRPLEGDIEPLEGETFDIFAASEEEWNAVAMEMAFGVFGLAAQISQ